MLPAHTFQSETGRIQRMILKTSSDAFFDQVMVMVEELDIRENRLALLKSLRDLFLQIADISLLVVAK